MKINALTLCSSLLFLGLTAQAQTAITGWGADSGESAGVVINDEGGGSFTATGTPTGNDDIRADLPTAVTGLSVGETLELSGTFSFTSGDMGGGVFRFGLLDFASLGTLSSGSWSVGPTATGYWFGAPSGGSGVSNPSGGEITGKPTSAGNAWLSGTGGYSVAGTGNNNSHDITPSTYNFSLSLDNTGSGIAITYDLSDTGDGGTYNETGTVTDSSGNVPLNFNAIGFFANGSDTAFGSAGGVDFSSVDETITPAPEPASLALFGLGGLVGAYMIRRRKA